MFICLNLYLTYEENSCVNRQLKIRLVLLGKDIVLRVFKCHVYVVR